MTPDGEILALGLTLVERYRSPCPKCGAHRYNDATRIYCTVCGDWWWRCRPHVKCKCKKDNAQETGAEVGN